MQTSAPGTRYSVAMNDPKIPDLAAAASILQGTIRQIEFARSYTLELLEATPRELWFEMPQGLPTHIAWQIGHLAVSQYGLLMFRIRGRQPDDLNLIPGKYRKAYSRGSVPTPDQDSQMSAQELFDRLAEVHESAMTEIRRVDPSVLLEPVDMPYAAYPIKLGAVLFCPLHEHIHSGQIGILRRALGLEKIR